MSWTDDEKRALLSLLASMQQQLIIMTTVVDRMSAHLEGAVVTPESLVAIQVEAERLHAMRDNEPAAVVTIVRDAETKPCDVKTPDP